MRGGVSLRIRADVRDYEQMAAAVDRMRANYGRLDVLICAAALQGPDRASAGDAVQSLDGDNRDQSDRCDEFRSRGAAAHDRETRRARSLSSAVAAQAIPRPYFSAYAASKAAVTRFVETVAEEIRDQNVQINVMSPGRTYTHMTDEILRAGDRAGQKEHDEAVEVRITGGMTPEKQIELALFLALGGLQPRKRQVHSRE